MSEFLQIAIHMPVLPFTVVLGLCAIYWIVVIVGAIDVELLDVDPGSELGSGADASVLDWGMLGLRWFNLGDVPLMVWVSAFAVTAWLAAALFDRELALEGVTLADSWFALLRNGAIGVFAAKVLTQPMKGRLRHREPNTWKEMLGRTVVVTSSEVTPQFGQAECQVEDGAPLKIHIRTIDGSLPKGAAAEIVDCEPEQHIYYVAPSSGE